MITENRIRECLRFKTGTNGPFWLDVESTAPGSDSSRLYLYRRRTGFVLYFAIGLDKGGISGVSYSARPNSDRALITVKGDADGYARLAEHIERQGIPVC